MEKIVNIVHCVDTEGPLYESLEATFERIHDIFGIEIQPGSRNTKTLAALQRENKDIRKMISSDLLEYKDTWDKIDKMLSEIMSIDFRNILKDSFGNGWKYNFFCIDWVGFSGENPRRRDMGFHNIFDHYKKLISKNDEIQFHNHPLSIKKDAHLTGITLDPIIYEVLSRRIIDRMWFPTAVRSGIERPDFHSFYEQWIPFNYGNSSMKENISEQRDLSNGRFGDWRHAPIDWEPYHPSYRDYQENGDCHRVIARCLNMRARVKEIGIDDFRDGFKRASLGLSTLIAFANHDYRDMKKEINTIRDMIQDVSEEYPDVKFRYCNAVEGIRRTMNMNEIYTPVFNLHLQKVSDVETILHITSQIDLYGTQPFFCIKTKSGEYIWQNLDYQNKNEWSYTFDFYTLIINAIDKIGIASNTDNGVCEIVVLDVGSNEIKKRVLNYV